MKNKMNCKGFNRNLIAIVLLFFALCISCFFGMGANKLSLSAKAETYEDDYKQNVIFQNFGYLAQKERIFREENPDSTPKEVVSFLKR